MHRFVAAALSPLRRTAPSLQARRLRDIENEPRLRFAPDAASRLHRDGLGGRWRLGGRSAHGRTLTGAPVRVDLEEFRERYLVSIAPPTDGD